MKRLVVPFAVMVVALFTLCSATAQDRKKKIDPVRLKRIMKKIDPEIRAAQQSLQAAKKRLQKALNDEVLSEKGAVEGKVIDQIKLAIKHTDNALNAANRAQRLDKGGD